MCYKPGVFTNRVKYSWWCVECPFSGDILSFPRFRIRTPRAWGEECSCPCAVRGAVCWPPILDFLFASLSSFPSAPLSLLGVRTVLFLRTQRAHYSRLLGDAESPTLSILLARSVSQCQSLAAVTPDQSGSSSVSFLHSIFSRKFTGLNHHLKRSTSLGIHIIGD